MGPGAAVCSNDVDSISCAPHRFSRPDRYHSAAMHGTHCIHDRQKEGMDISLFRIRTLERHHHILGVQRHCRWRNLRSSRKRIPDVTRLRTFPSEQEEILRSTAIYIPNGHMDSMGEVLLRCRDLMAMACARKLLCPKHMGNPVV